MKSRNCFFLFSFFIILCTGYSQLPNYVPSAGLLAWYPFNGNANDAGPAAHNGTVNGATTTNDRFNTNNSAYYFDGVDDYISIADNSVNFRPKVFTIAAWVLFENFSNSYSQIICKNVNGSTWYESIGLAHLSPLGDWLAITGSPTGISSSYLQPAGVPTLNTWYHLVYQYDNVNNLQSLYLNGVVISTATASSIIGYDSREWTIGAEYENGPIAYFLEGKIDDIGIWERILTPCEIAQLYAASAFSATSSSPIICAGQTATLTASGANSYVWNNNFSGPNYIINPPSNTAYTVSGTYANNVICTSTIMQSVGLCTSLENLNNSKEKTVRVFPNPANENLILEFTESSAEKAVIQISNCLGQLVNCESEIYENQISLDVKNLPKGLYFMSIEYNLERQTIRFLKE